MANLNFRWGSYADFKTQILDKDGAVKNGTIYVATHDSEDGHNGVSMFIGNNGKAERVQGTVLYFESLNEFATHTSPPYSSDVIYFLAQENALVRWDPNITDGKGEEPGGWVQLNVTAGSFNSQLETISSAIDNINSAIATNGQAIAANKAAIEENEAAIAVNAQAIADNKAAIEANDGELADHETRIAELERVVGDEDSGLVSTVNNHGTLLVEHGNTLNNHTGRIETLESGVADNEAAIAANDGAIKALQQRMEAVDGESGEIAGLKTRVGKLETFQTDTTTTLTEMNAAIVEAQETADQGVADAKTNKDNLDALTERVDTIDSDLNSETTGLKARMTAVETKNSTQDDEIANIKINATNLANRVTDVESDLNTATTGLKARMTTAESDIDTLQSQMENLIKTDGRLDTIEDAAAALTERVGKNETDIADLKTNLKNVSDTVTDQGETLDDHETRLEAAEGTIETHTNNISDLNDHINRIDGIIGTGSSSDTLSGRLEQAEKDIADLKVTDTNLNTAIGNNATAIGNLADRVTALDSTDGRVAAIEGRLSTAENTISNQGQTLSNHGTSISDLQTLTGTHATSIADLQQTKADLTYVNDMKGQLSDQIAADINAANSMTYQDGVGAPEDLPSEGENTTAGWPLRVGDTYIVTESFEMTVKGIADPINVYPGDLLVATGTEEDGAIANNTLAWVHVKSGYIFEHEAKLTNETVTAKQSVVTKLSSHIAPRTGDLGSFTLKSLNENLEINLNANTIEINSVWLGFTDA